MVWNRFRMKRVLLILPLLLSCEAGGSAEYTNEMKENFSTACFEATPRSMSKSQAIKYCQCSWKGVSTTIPIEDFLKLDRGEAMSPSSNLILRELVAKCGGRPNDLQLKNQ